MTYTFAGLRPLVRDQSVGGNTAKVTREHRIARVAPGVLAIVGGKWTTYRVMARDLVDTVLGEAGRQPRPCRTQSIPLVGSAGETEAGVAALAARGSALAQPLADAPGFPRADVALRLPRRGCLRGSTDVIDRRLRLGINLDEVTEAPCSRSRRSWRRSLGWDESRIEREVAGYSVSHVPL